MMTPITIEVDSRVRERLDAYALYMTMRQQESVEAGELPPGLEPWGRNDAARALLGLGTVDWELTLREMTGLRTEPIMDVVRATRRNRG